MAFYHDQHLAWQQRVSKEITSASRFYDHYQPLPKFNTTPQTSSTKPVIKPAVNKQFYQSIDSQFPGVYAEVRGKYARPPPLMQKSIQRASLAPQDNFLLARPSTSGSLKPRSASVKSSNPHHDQSVERTASPIKAKIVKYRSASKEASEKLPVSLERKNKTRTEEKIAVKEAEVNDIQDVEKKETEGNEEDLEELRDEVEVNPMEGRKDEDVNSYVSGVTTSSQRRYILELEALLRQEKIRRIQLEETLKKAMETQ